MVERERKMTYSDIIKTASAQPVPRVFTDAKRPEMTLPIKVLTGRMRNKLLQAAIGIGGGG